MRAVAQDRDPIEHQARFRAIPINELVDGVTIAPLCVCGVKVVQRRGFGLFRSGRRRTDLVLLRFLREVGFCFMIRGLQNHRSMISAASQVSGQG
jgi:hypothetical protein